MHPLHIHTCYITYPIDLKSPLFTFISNTTFLSNKVWPKNYFRVSTYIRHYKLYGGVRTLICIAWCPQWYLFRTVNFYIFILYTKLVIIKRNEEHISLHRIPPCTPLSCMHTKLSLGPLKVSPQKIHACFIFLSRYMQWRSLYLKRKHDTYIGLRINSLRSPFTFSGYYAVTGSPYNSVFAHDMTSWPVKRSTCHL